MIVSVLILALMQPALTDRERAERLYVDCKNAIRIMDSSNGSDVYLGRSASCMDYIDGFVDGANISEQRICLHEASLLTLARVYVAFMDKNPTWMSEFRAFTLMASLQDAYPCKPELPRK